MGPIEGLLYGFSIALAPGNLFACFIGVLIGTVVGILPGIGPVGAMALLLPSTFALEPATALIMLAGIYYGAMYGGSTTSILVNVPGEAGSVVTAIDGYQMTRKGRAGAALAVAGVGSFVAGTLGVVGIVLASSWLADQALRFGPPEYFALAFAGPPAALAPERRLGAAGLRAGGDRPGPRHRRHGADLGDPALHLRLDPALAGRRAGPGDHGALRGGRGAPASRRPAPSAPRSSR